MAYVHIKRILIEEGAGAYALGKRILKRLGSLPKIHVSDDTGRNRSDPLDMDKESLHLRPFKGEFLKPCPGTKEGYICCGYQILNVGTNCPMDCSYCILQAYFNQPSLRVFVNLENEMLRIGQLLDKHPEKTFRIGTGEFTDSLALDPIVCWHEILFPFFSGKKNAVIELKTKTCHIEGLLSSKYRDRIIVSWSLNSPYTASRDEHGAPGIEKRLKAAKKCQEQGFKLGFHFDPLIKHRGWKDDYKKTLDMMDRYIDPKGIIWISMGCMRYMPPLKAIIRRRHPDTSILNGEFVPGLDGKMRYFKPIRIEMYAYMAEIIRQWHQDPGLYLCMESNEVWQRGLGWSPVESEGLSQYLDGRVNKIFGR